MRNNGDGPGPRSVRKLTLPRPGRQATAVGVQRLRLAARLQPDGGRVRPNSVLEVRNTFPTDREKQPDTDRHHILLRGVMWCTFRK